MTRVAWRAPGYIAKPVFDPATRDYARKRTLLVASALDKHVKELGKSIGLAAIGVPTLAEIAANACYFEPKLGFASAGQFLTHHRLWELVPISCLARAADAPETANPSRPSMGEPCYRVELSGPGAGRPRPCNSCIFWTNNSIGSQGGGR